MPPVKLQPNVHRQVVDQLGRLIVSGSMAPGDALPSEELLAGQLAVSRSALREAMKVLGAKGLIESRQKTGARVRERRFWHQLDADVLRWRFATMPTQAFIAELAEMSNWLPSPTLIRPWRMPPTGRRGPRPMRLFTAPC
jgi:DNA-binding FadR family transcriptional regulator